MEHIVNLRRNILVFGQSAVLGELAAILRVSPLLQVAERKTSETLGQLRPNVILVDSALVTPEQFRDLMGICPIILSVDPETHQLNLLSSPRQSDLAETARVIETISLTLHQPA
jgi:hypothetical protein